MCLCHPYHFISNLKEFENFKRSIFYLSVSFCWRYWLIIDSYGFIVVVFLHHHDLSLRYGRSSCSSPGCVCLSSLPLYWHARVWGRLSWPISHGLSLQIRHHHLLSLRLSSSLPTGYTGSVCCLFSACTQVRGHLHGLCQCEGLFEEPQRAPAFCPPAPSQCPNQADEAAGLRWGLQI